MGASDSKPKEGSGSTPQVPEGRKSIAHEPNELFSPRRGNDEASGPLAESLGNATRHGVSPGSGGAAYAKINQDRGVAHWPYNGSHNEALFCVFDGHGRNGEKVSEFCVKAIPAALQEVGAELRADPPAVLHQTVIEVDKKVLKKDGGSFANMCGTTSTIVYVQGSTCWVACSGDSRAVMGYVERGSVKARDLSVDMKPDAPGEKERILAAGGEVSVGRGNGPSRVWCDGRVGLAMSRSIGDGECKKYGVIADPQIRKFDIDVDRGDRFIICASDGVWEFISSKEACQIVAKESASASKACASLVQAAAQRWKKVEGNYRDDITAIVVRLPFIQPDADEPPKTLDQVGVSGSVSGRLSGHIDLDGGVYINLGETGLEQIAEGRLSTAGAGGGGGGDASDFAKRRLSVAAKPADDDDWENGSSGDDLEVEVEMPAPAA